jgi:hypothetical protein
MRPVERRDGGQHDLLRSRLDQIVDLAHPLAKLGRSWGAASIGVSSKIVWVRSTRTVLAGHHCRHG